MFTFVSLVSSITVLFVIVFDIIVLYSPYSWDFFSYEICGLLNCTDMIHGFLSAHMRGFHSVKKCYGFLGTQLYFCIDGCI